MSNTETVADLRAAADLIRTNGWWDGKAMSTPQAQCLVSATYRVTGSIRRAERALAAVRSFLAVDDPLSIWNDAQESGDVVADLMDDVALKLELADLA